MTIRKLFAGATLALLLLAAGPQLMEAQSLVWWDYNACAGATFNPCVDFELYDADEDLGTFDYFFKVTYVGSLGSPEGALTAAGIYDYDNDNANSPYDFTVTSLEHPAGNWTYSSNDGCSQLGGFGGTFFEACADTDSGINDGVAPGDYVQFNFTSNQQIEFGDFATLSDGGELGARAHIQGIDQPDCSFKVDSPQGLVSTDCPGEVVPEPMTVLLMATGLLGVGAVGYTRRRREDEAEV